MTKTPMILALAATLAIAATGLSALAQRPAGGGGMGGPGGGGGGRGMRMYEALGLKPDQKAKIEAMSKKHRDAQQALRKKQMDEIKAVLTPEQRKKLDAQMAEMRQRMGGMMGGGGAPGGGGMRPGGGKPK